MGTTLSPPASIRRTGGRRVNLSGPLAGQGLRFPHFRAASSRSSTRGRPRCWRRWSGSRSRWRSRSGSRSGSSRTSRLQRVFVWAHAGRVRAAAWASAGSLPGAGGVEYGVDRSQYGDAAEAARRPTQAVVYLVDVAVILAPSTLWSSACMRSVPRSGREMMDGSPAGHPVIYGVRWLPEPGWHGRVDGNRARGDLCVVPSGRVGVVCIVSRGGCSRSTRRWPGLKGEGHVGLGARCSDPDVLAQGDGDDRRRRRSARSGRRRAGMLGPDRGVLDQVSPREVTETIAVQPRWHHARAATSWPARDSGPRAVARSPCRAAGLTSPWPRYDAYAAFKAGVAGLTENVASAGPGRGQTARRRLVSRRSGPTRERCAPV